MQRDLLGRRQSNRVHQINVSEPVTRFYEASSPRYCPRRRSDLHIPQRDRYRRAARPDHNRLTAPRGASADVRSPCRVVDGAIGTTCVQPSNKF